MDQGGDDWAKPWAIDFLREILNYDTTIQYNDISNMNGGFTPDHDAHQKGNLVDMIYVGLYAGHGKEGTTEPWPKTHPTEDLDIIDRLIEFHKQPNFLRRIFKTLITHNIWLKENTAVVPARKEADFDKIDYIDNAVTWNRLRHICLPDGRYAKSVIRSDIIKGHPVHGDHFHVEMIQDQYISPKPTGTIDLKFSFASKGAEDIPYEKVIFSEEIFTTNEKRELYEVFIEKQVEVKDRDGQFLREPYKEFVPFTEKERIAIPYGKHKIKVVKVKGYSTKEETGASNFTCHQDIPFEGEVDSTTRKSVEYFWMTIKPEGICNGEFLKPMRTTVQALADGKELPYKEVGFVADNVSIDSTSGVGSNSYACSGTKLSNYSFISGEDLGHVEIYNSEIKGGSHISGSALIANSVIDHTEIQGKFAKTEDQLLDFSEFLKLNYVVTEDKLNSPVFLESVPPIFMGGYINISGVLSSEVIIERDKTTFSNNSLIGSFLSSRGGQLNIVGSGIELYDTDITINRNLSTLPFGDNKVEILDDTILSEGRVWIETVGDLFSKITIIRTQASEFFIGNVYNELNSSFINVENSFLSGVSLNSSNVSNSTLDGLFASFSAITNSKIKVSTEVDHSTNTVLNSNVDQLEATGSIIIDSVVKSCKFDLYQAREVTRENQYCRKVDMKFKDFEYYYQCRAKNDPNDKGTKEAPDGSLIPEDPLP